MTPETPLARRIARMVRASGGLSIADYMAACLADPEHGYYMTRDPLGARGDFTTAPEVSQMFGEIVGLWAADMWAKLGAPSPVVLAELGPGRGTLMADALRAARVVPRFADAIRVHLVEMSPVLRQRQHETLEHEGLPVAWHDSPDSVPTGPAIVIANEFFDALPVVQHERVDGCWRERLVVLDDDGRLAIGHGDPMPGPPANAPAGVPDGSIWEHAPLRNAVVARLASRFVADPGAALIIDYGHTVSGLGDTLQAVRRHEPIGILDAPGESDLTSHVDFAALARSAARAGAACHGPIDMGAFLTALGVGERAARLRSGKPSGTRRDIDAALARLTAPDRMGSLFKVLAITSPGAPAPEPFATDPSMP